MKDMFWLYSMNNKSFTSAMVLYWELFFVTKMLSSSKEFFQAFVNFSESKVRFNKDGGSTWTFINGCCFSNVLDERQRKALAFKFSDNTKRGSASCCEMF